MEQTTMIGNSWKLKDEQKNEIRLLAGFLTPQHIADIYNLDRSTIYHYFETGWHRDQDRIERIDSALRRIYRKEFENEERREVRRVIRNSERKIERIKGKHLDSINLILSSPEYKRYLEIQKNRDQYDKETCPHCLPNGESALTTRCGLCGHIEGSRSPKLL